MAKRRKKLDGPIDYLKRDILNGMFDSLCGKYHCLTVEDVQSALHQLADEVPALWKEIEKARTNVLQDDGFG